MANLQPAILAVEKVDWASLAKNNKFRKTDSLILSEWHTKIGGVCMKKTVIWKQVVWKWKIADVMKVATLKKDHFGILKLAIIFLKMFKMCHNWVNLRKYQNFHYKNVSI